MRALSVLFLVIACADAGNDDGVDAAFGDGEKSDGGDGGLDALDEGIASDDDPDAPCRKLSRDSGVALVADEVTLFVLAGLSDLPGIGSLTGILQSTVDTGSLMPVIELFGLDDPSGVFDKALTAGVFEMAADVDGDPSDNLSGSEALCLISETLTDGDAPSAVVDATLGSSQDGQLHGEEDVVVFPSLLVMGVPTPAVPIHDFVLDADLKADVAGMESSHQEGVAWISEMNDIATVLGPLLPVIACGSSAFMLPATPPDRDVDGDGLETFTCDGNSIVSCGDFDENGDPIVIEGDDCGGQLADGYSFILEFSAVRFAIDGVLN